MECCLQCCLLCCKPKNCKLCFLSLTHSCYHSCCCRLDCTSGLDPNEAISRYEEDPPLNKDEFVTNVLSNPFIKLFLNGFSVELPEYFLSILPTGSLREGFGKLLPSTAVLASDYDVMIIPDAVSAADEGNQLSEKPVFTVVESHAIRTGYVWLRLENPYLKQWEELCIRRQTENKGCSYLSSHKIHDLLRAKFFNVDKMREKNVKIKRGSVEITVEQNGPALTVKIADKDKSAGCCGCCSQMDIKREGIVFYCDFTFGLYCPLWPRKSGWFDEERRNNRWPGSRVADEIRRIGCHVVPKPSTESLVKMHEEQPLNTTYSQSPGLEWRYSFSQPEILLSENVAPQARSAYLALKAVNKRHISKGLEKGLPSYTLKCLLFRFMEEKDDAYWQTNPKPIEIFGLLLDSLHLHLLNGFFPHYWIEEINLIEDLDAASRTYIQYKIGKVREKPQVYIADNWLEVTRCLRYNCCASCGNTSTAPKGLIVTQPAVTDPCCCTIPCTYSKDTCCCGPWPYDTINMDVY